MLVCGSRQPYKSFSLILSEHVLDVYPNSFPRHLFFSSSVSITYANGGFDTTAYQLETGDTFAFENDAGIVLRHALCGSKTETTACVVVDLTWV